jgi:hypothetical protein
LYRYFRQQPTDLCLFQLTVLLCFQFCSFISKAFIPGKIFPSRSSKNAPPAVDIYVNPLNSMSSSNIGIIKNNETGDAINKNQHLYINDKVTLYDKVDLDLIPKRF